MMKLNIPLLILLVCFTTLKLAGQKNASISDDPTYTPNASAILDIHSMNGDKGLLIPRVTTTQRMSIPNPVPGLLVFDNTLNEFAFYNGAAWTMVSGEGTASNGLTASGDEVKMGGTLTENTTIDSDGNNIVWETPSLTPAVDVSQLSQGCGAGGSDNSNYYQTFTCTTSGQLTGVALKFFTSYGENINVTVYDGSGTGGGSLGTATITKAADVTAAFTNISVTSGNVYTFQLSDASGIRTACSNAYAGGTSDFSGGGFDLVFETIVSVNGPTLPLFNIAAASTNVGIGQTTPDPSAILDIDAVDNDKGILIPRLTTTERTAISSPATSLMVYDTDLNRFYFYNGSAWASISGGVISNGTLNGTDLEITDAGGVTTIDLTTAVNNDTNELITGGTLNGTDLEITEAGATTTIDLSTLVNTTDASNGLTASGDEVKMGGTLTENTYVDAGSRSFEYQSSVLAAVVDVSQLSQGCGAGGSDNSAYYQTWTSGVTGYVTGVNLKFFTSLGENITLTVYDGAGTGGSVLETASFTKAADVTIPFSTVPVSNGNVYTFQLSDASGIRTSCSNVYAGGSSDFSGGGFDLVFEIVAGSSSNAQTVLNINGQTGNIGIGTDAPDQMLSVNGDASKVGGGTWMTFSDKRLKKDIVDFKDGLNVIKQIQPKKFKYNGKAGYPNDGKEYIGVIAQEAQRVAPYLVQTTQKKLNPTDKGTTELLMYDASSLTYSLINAIKEQQEMIENMKEEIKKMQHKISNQ